MQVAVIDGAAPEAQPRFARMRALFERCYEQRGLAYDPTTKGALVFELAVDTFGAVKQTRVAFNGGITWDAVACMTSALKPLRFGAAADGTQLRVTLTCKVAKTP